jgi:hypothetical protein
VSQSDAQSPATPRGQKKPLSIHRTCDRVKRVAFDVAVTIIFLILLVKFVSFELGL